MAALNEQARGLGGEGAGLPPAGPAAPRPARRPRAEGALPSGVWAGARGGHARGVALTLPTGPKGRAEDPGAETLGRALRLRRLAGGACAVWRAAAGSPVSRHVAEVAGHQLGTGDSHAPAPRFQLSAQSHT